LLRDCVAIELNVLFSKGGIIEIHCPLSCAVVRIDVDLTLGNGAEKGSSQVLPRINEGTFSQIDSVVGTDDAARDTKRRFADSYRDRCGICRPIIAETELKEPTCVLRDIAEAKRSGVIVRNPASVGRLELKDSFWLVRSCCKHVDDFRAAVRHYVDKGSEIG
jgi:hypothetical protein